MKKTVPAALLLCLLLTAGLTGCHSDTSPAGQGTGTQSTDTAGSSTDDSGSNVGGIGMTYTGKIGINMGGGLVVPMSGGAPQLGMGF